MTWKSAIAQGARQWDKRSRRLMALPGMIVTVVLAWIVLYPQLGWVEIGLLTGVGFPAVYVALWWVVDWVETKQTIAETP